MIALAALALAASAPDRVDAVAAKAGFAGELLVGKGDRVLLDRGFGSVDPAGGARHRAGARWPLASITKQVMATMAVRDGLPRLDQPIGPMPDSGALENITLRQLLQHHSGLPNPDATPAATDGVPSFYKAARPNADYCLSAKARPSSFSYNNCDYIVAAALLSQDVRKPFADRWPAGMAMARPGERLVPGFVHGKPQPPVSYAAYGSAGGLVGTARAVFAFDRALMSGRLLPPAARAELWRPEGGGSAQALGQWVFSAPLRGCAGPVRIVQRDGEIEGVQARNFILPDADVAVVLFTNRSSDDFAIGEVWQQSGFAYELLSAAACPA